jgi:FkbM family methyltransferase
VRSRTTGDKIIHKFVDNALLYACHGQTGVTGNIYCGLHEWNEMTFTLHFLRPGDYFIDVGANVGSYTVLASKAVGAITTAIEPVPVTYQLLLENIELNAVNNLVQCLNIGVGSVPGQQNFTINRDTGNRVAQKNDTDVVKSIAVDTLDHICARTPTMLKIDVEGYEYEVLLGSSRILSDDKLCVLIVEWNDEIAPTDKIYQTMIDHDFVPMLYEPMHRSLSTLEYSAIHGNALFVRNAGFVGSRVSSSKTYSVQGKSI